MVSNELPFISHGMTVNENSHAFLLSTLIPNDNRITCSIVRLRLTKTFLAGVPIPIGMMLAKTVFVVNVEATLVCELIDAFPMHHEVMIND
jgi:hypothetical protein